MCMKFGCNPQINFHHLFRSLNLVPFWLHFYHVHKLRFGCNFQIIFSHFFRRFNLVNCLASKGGGGRHLLFCRKNNSSFWG